MGLKSASKILSVRYASWLKSDQNGIEIQQSRTYIQHQTELKSDQNGIEISEFLEESVLPEGLKSDQNGIEILLLEGLDEA